MGDNDTRLRCGRPIHYWAHPRVVSECARPLGHYGECRPLPLAGDFPKATP